MTPMHALRDATPVPAPAAGGAIPRKPWALLASAIGMVALVAAFFYLAAIIGWHYDQGGGLSTGQRTSYRLRSQAIVERVSLISSDPRARFEPDGGSWRYVSDAHGSMSRPAGSISDTFTDAEPANIIRRVIDWLYGLERNRRRVFTRVLRGPEGPVVAFVGMSCEAITGRLSAYTVARARGAWSPRPIPEGDPAPTALSTLEWSDPGRPRQACEDWFGPQETFMLRFDVPGAP